MWPQHTLQMFADYCGPSNTIPNKPSYKKCCKPERIQYRNQPTLYHHSQDQLHEFCTGIYETFNSEFPDQGNFKHDQFSGKHWYCWWDSKLAIYCTLGENCINWANWTPIYDFFFFCKKCHGHLSVLISTEEFDLKTLLRHFKLTDIKWRKLFKIIPIPNTSIKWTTSSKSSSISLSLSEVLCWILYWEYEMRYETCFHKKREQLLNFITKLCPNSHY